MKKYLKISFPLIIFILALSQQALAALSLTNPLAAGSFKEIVDTLLNFVTILAVTVAPIFIIYAGYLYMTSGGEPGKIKTAKSVLTYALIGLAVILLSKALISVLMNVIGVKQATGQ